MQVGWQRLPMDATVEPTAPAPDRADPLMHADQGAQDDRLLHCSEDRIVVLHKDAETGALEVHKVLLRGSQAEAERESAIALRLQHLRIAPPLGAGIDPTTGRPIVRTRHCDGQDLEQLVVQQGALPASVACRLLLPIAETLAAMHATRAADAPHGLCHGDVKPANLLAHNETTLLLDFEHAGPAQHGWCSGTAGYAGPESLAQAPLTPAFDVYGLGASLCFLLTGAPPDGRMRALAAHDDELRMLIEACLSPSPTARPSADTVADALRELAQRLEHDACEPARAALLSGDLEQCERLLAPLGDAHGVAAVRSGLTSARRLLDRATWAKAALLGTANEATDVLEEPKRATAQLRRARSLIRRFPCARAPWQAIRNGKQQALSLAQSALATGADLSRKEQFARAHEHIASLDRMLDEAMRTPGRLAPAPSESAAMPSLLSRAPQARLRQETERIAAIERDHAELLMTLHAAEAEFALEDASAVVERIGANFGGASEAVARHRDRLHRLAFYLERIAQARERLERLFLLAPNEDPRALRTLIADCAAAVSLAPGGTESASGSIGLRSLSLSLDNLDEEYPAVRERIADARASLLRMLAASSDEAWTIVGEAFETLQKTPVPVRPLQLQLARLDALRAIEALVDRPQRARTALLDRIETLRLRIEQAQAARDRLARGAEEAMARGHWTTGLFDMERAAQHAEDDDAQQDLQSEALRKRLIEARRRKQDLEDTQRRTHELQARYAALEDDPQSSADDRLQSLRELRECLSFLAAHSQKERSLLYARDLRDADLRIAEEQAHQHEAEADRADSPERALQIAERAMRDLEAARDAFSDAAEIPGRLRRLLEHWQLRHATFVRLRDEQAARQRRSAIRRRAVVALGAAAIAVVAILIGSSMSTDAHAASSLVTIAEQQPEGLRPAARNLAQAIRDIEKSPASALHSLVQTETVIARALSISPNLDAFAAAAFDHFVATATANAAVEQRAEIATLAAAARIRLHLPPPR
jgi:hypothetical protein